MNGVHDMGGMHGMGPIEPESNEPVFHDRWEGRVHALRAKTAEWEKGRHWGSHRFALESLPAADYLRMSYYERWFRVLVGRLLNSHLVSSAELVSGTSDPVRPRPARLSASSEASTGGSGRLPVMVTARFRTDESVRARTMHPRGHTRLPRYTRGRCGTVVKDHGVFALQDTDANGQRLHDRPQHVYTVRFAARELWGDRAPGRDAVYVDLWEDYLEPT